VHSKINANNAKDPAMWDHFQMVPPAQYGWIWKPLFGDIYRNRRGF